MQTVKALYDGTNIRLLQPAPVKDEWEVLVTFVEPTNMSGVEADRRAMFGCLKGKINVPDDFNEPLEDFKEYM